MATARVLVVDDDSMMLDVVSRVLTRAGYEVLPANGAGQALEIVSNPPHVDLVVSDLELPAMQGTQLVREVAQISPQTAGLLMTGSTINPVDVPDGVPVLKKPIAMSDLISAVQATLAESAQLSAASGESVNGPAGYSSEAENCVQTPPKSVGDLVISGRT